MDSNAIIQLALIGLNASLRLVAELKAQHGLSDDELLALAEQINSETRASAQSFLDKLNG